MSILDKIENLQKKPEHVRRIILAVVMIVLMLGVVSVWFLNFRRSLAKNDKPANSASAPFSVFKSLMIDGFDMSASGVKEGMGKLKEVISN